MGELEGKFYFSLCERHDRLWEGPFDTRAEAVDEAMCVCDGKPFETFWAKSWSALYFLPEAEWMLERYLENIGDNYAESVTDDLHLSMGGVKPEAKAELNAKLREVFGDWLGEQGLLPDLYLEQDIIRRRLQHEPA